MKKNVLVDVAITCDPPTIWGMNRKSMEDIAQEYESWVQDFHWFIRDHRSQDPVTLNVERQYQDVCSFCECEWEVDENGMPVCCGEAMDEWDAARKTKEAQAQHTTNATSVAVACPSEH